MNQIGEVLRRRANEIAKSSGTYTEKSDHHESVELALTRRTDLPSDRLPLFDKMKAEIAALQKENEELQQSIKKQVSAWRTSDECKAKLHQERDREIIRLRSLDADNKGLKECNVILTEENAAQAKRIAELEAGVVDIRDWTARWTRPDHPIVTVANRLLPTSKNGDSK